MVTGQEPVAEIEDVEAQLRAIREDISSLTGLLRELAAGKVELLRDAAVGAQRTADSIEAYIAEKPVHASLIALLTGIFIGSLARR